MAADARKGKNRSMDPRGWPWIFLLAAFVLTAYGALFSWWASPHALNRGGIENDVIVDFPYADPISPLPSEIAVDRQKADLGRDLFFDPLLSGGGDVSCSSCHDLSLGGDDGLPKSIGTAGNETSRNAPTVLNAVFNLAQTWDGRAPTLESQIDRAIENPKEMNGSWRDIVDKLSADDRYARSFRAIYADGVTANNVKDAIASFERTLITPNSRFDQFLRGDKKALSALEEHGYRIFLSAGCASCHQGRNLGGNLFQKMGLIRPYFQGRRIRSADLGRFNVTGIQADRHVFKVPTLRNVALTAPYFHDGSVETLEHAVWLMGYHQLGRDLSQQEIRPMVAFLETLTGEQPR